MQPSSILERPTIVSRRVTIQKKKKMLNNFGKDTIQKQKFYIFEEQHFEQQPCLGYIETKKKKKLFKRKINKMKKRFSRKKSRRKRVVKKE